MNTDQIIKQYQKFVINTYTRAPLVVVKGKGLKVWDLEGNEYLDFFPGWAVSGLGHCHPKVVNAVRNYLKKIIHVPNNFYNMLQGRLAEKIVGRHLTGDSLTRTIVGLVGRCLLFEFGQHIVLDRDRLFRSRIVHCRADLVFAAVDLVRQLKIYGSDAVGRGGLGLTKDLVALGIGNDKLDRLLDRRA